MRGIFGAILGQFRIFWGSARPLHFGGIRGIFGVTRGVLGRCVSAAIWGNLGDFRVTRGVLGTLREQRFGAILGIWGHRMSAAIWGNFGVNRGGKFGGCSVSSILGQFWAFWGGSQAQDFGAIQGILG